jgi:hypothetical protein
MPRKTETQQDDQTQPEDARDATPPAAKMQPTESQSAEETPPEGETPTAESDAETAFLGLVVIGAFLYFGAVWGQLPSQRVRWLVTVALAVALVVLWVALRQWSWLQKKLERRSIALRRWGVVASDFLMFLLVVAAIILASILLDAEDQVVLLKLFAVVYFSMLPAVLYLQFSSRKTLTVWKEYVLNLYKLRADDLANLPRPPTLSRFFAPWKASREKAFPGTLDDEVARKLEWANIYRVKFRDLFGPVPDVEAQWSVLSLRSVHKLQVVITTILVTIGWVFVVQPETVFGQSVLPSDFELANLPPIPRETFAFAFLGAYFYILQMLVRRYFQNDLKATAYINATMRIVVVVLIVWTVDPLLQDSTTQAERNAIAFVIGVFPTVGWQLLVQTLVRVPGLVIDSLRPTYRLTDLDGLNVWYESRLLEVGIEDMQNLATTDIVDLMLNTRIPVDRLLDWIDQAFLYLRVTDKDERATLRGYGIRSATDLLDIFEDDHLATKMERLLNKKDEEPSRMRSLVATLGRERNLQHVQAWKSFEVEEEAVRRVAKATTALPEPEAPPGAAPVPT